MDVPIVPDAPAAYFATVPVKRIVNAICGAGIAAQISDTAGTYVCNQLFYGALHYISVNSLPVRAGFIHVPRITEQGGGRVKEQPAMDIESVVKALEIAVRETADYTE